MELRRKKKEYYKDRVLQKNNNLNFAFTGYPKFTSKTNRLEDKPQYKAEC